MRNPRREKKTMWVGGVVVDVDPPNAVEDLAQSHVQTQPHLDLRFVCKYTDLERESEGPNKTQRERERERS